MFYYHSYALVYQVRKLPRYLISSTLTSLSRIPPGRVWTRCVAGEEQSDSDCDTQMATSSEVVLFPAVNEQQLSCLVTTSLFAAMDLIKLFFFFKYKCNLSQI